jgi:hypothetical protein
LAGRRSVRFRTSHHRWEAFLYEYSLIPYLLPMATTGKARLP